jgi:hypothetical protein
VGNRHRSRQLLRWQAAGAGTMLAFASSATMPRGTIVYGRADLNTAAERGVRRDGSDRHPVKRRPLVVWQVRSDGDLEAVPMTSDHRGIGRPPPVVRLSTLGGRGLDEVGALVCRLVVVRAPSVDWCGPLGALLPDEVARMEQLVAAGIIEDLRAVTGDTAPQPAYRFGAAAADRAIAELCRRRRAIIADHERAWRRDVPSRAR